MDAVIAWVDGSDPAHCKKRNMYLARGLWHKRATDNTRFDSAGEIYYCIASILKYAKFFRKIWLVTDNQKPSLLSEFSREGLCPDDFIEVIDHQEIFSGFDDVLPCFNSRSIESVIHRIPGLCESFVYFNDDFFLNREISPLLFFKNGRPVLHGKIVDPKKWRAEVGSVRSIWQFATGRQIPVKPSFRRAQQRAAALAGVKGEFLQIDHTPHPLRKSVISEFHAAYPEILPKQISFRFRNAMQYAPIALANHLEIKRYKAEWSVPVPLAYVGPQNVELAAFKDMKEGYSPFGCIQSIDQLESEELRMLRIVLHDKFRSHLPKSIVTALEGSSFEPSM